MPQLAVAAWSAFTTAATATAATLSAVGIGSAVATAIGYAVTAAKVASGVMSVASQLGYGAQKEPSLASQWAQNKLTIEASPPRTIAVGRTALAGALRAHFQTGRNGDIFSQIIALSGAGPIESIDGVVIERQNYSINTSTNQVSYAPNDFWMTYRLGDWAQSSLPTNFNGYALDAITQWTSTHKGAGIAHAMIAMRASDKAFPKGRPQPLVLVKGHTELIDPRTGTTATAAHRDNPAVWEYSWRLGLKSPPAYGSVRLGGFFKDVSQLYTADYAAWANVCTNNGWKVSGEINLNNDDREAVSRAICQAGGAVPITKSGKDSVFYSSPKTSVGTISSSDIFGELDIQYSPEIRDRINGIVPKFRSEAHGWEIVPGSLVTSSSYISEDGGTRVGDLQFDLVNLSAQAGQLAAYKVIQARERLFITGQFHPRVLDYEIGEAVTIDFPEYDLSGIKCIIEGRDTGASGAIKLALRSETDSKHSWALGQTITVPDTTLPQLSDGTLSAPSSSAWTKTAVTISSGNTQIPIIRLTGAAESSRVKKILVDYRVSPSGGWKSLPAFDASIADIEIDNVTPSTLYEIRIAYQSESGFVSSYTSLGTVTTGTFVAGSAASVDWGGVGGTGKPQDNANNTALNPTTGALTGISSGAGTIVDNTKISIGANGALNGAGGGQITIGGLGYTGALNATRNAVSSGTAAPSGGSNGDMYVQVDGSGNAVLSWVNIGGTWKPDYDAKTNVATLQSQIAGSTGSALLTAINQKIDTATANANFATASSLAATNAKINTNPNLMPYPVPKNFTDLPSTYGWVSTGNGLGFSNADGLSWKSNFYFLNRYQANASATSLYAYFDISSEVNLYNNTYITLSYVAGFSINPGDYSQCYIEIVDNSGAHIAWATGGWQTMGATAPNRFSNTFLINLGSTLGMGTFKIRMHFALNMGATTALVYQYLFFTDIKLEFGNVATAFTLEGNNKALQAQTSINQTAIAETNGNVNAIISLNASTNTKKAEFVLAADKSVSAIRMTADVMQIGDAPNGTFRNAFQVVSGQTQINDALIRNLQVLANASDTMGFPVALKPRKFSGIDGANITFPGTLTSIPYVRWDGQNPPAVGSGETYQIKADNVSGTGFTVSAKKFVAGTTNVRDSGAGSNVGGTPTWQVNKPTTEVADGNAFNYFVTVAVPRTGFHALGGGYYDFSYYGEIDVYYYNGSVWIYLFTDIIDISGEQYGTPATTLTYTNYQIQANFTLGANGKFGVHPKAGSNITAFNKVTYSVTAQSSAVSLAGTWSFDVTA